MTMISPAVHQPKAALLVSCQPPRVQLHVATFAEHTGHCKACLHGAAIAMGLFGEATGRMHFQTRVAIAVSVVLWPMVHRQRGGRCFRHAHVGVAAKSMSPMTAQLMAIDAIAALDKLLQPTPARWISNVDERAHVRRYGQTVRYIQTTYSQVLHVLPVGMDGNREGQLRTLVATLCGLCDKLAEQISETLAEQDTHQASVPKYYYSQLRHKQDCMLPEPPEAFNDGSLLRFLSLEAVACLRNAECFELLSEARSQDVSVESWTSFAKQARAMAIQLVSGMILIYSEQQVLQVLKASIREEHTVYMDLVDVALGRQPLASQDDDKEEEDEDDEDDEDDNGFCDVLDAKNIFVVSDCTGESAERTVRCSLGQFEHCFDRCCPTQITTFRFCTQSMISGIAKRARDEDALIVFTLMDPLANAKMVEVCTTLDVEHHDLWSPLLSKLELYLDSKVSGLPGKTLVDDKYMQIIDCIEYTRTLDDGVLPNRWKEADLMIVGPSRSGKTPLAFFMAQRGFKVANFPLVPGDSLPKQLFEFPQDHVFALTIDARKLSNIRNNRVKTLKMSSSASYATVDKVRNELNWCRKLYTENPRWTVMDTTDSGVEETCARILMILEDAGLQKRTASPSAI